MKWLDRIPLWLIALVAVYMVLAPFVPEPHLWQKLKMLFAGELTRRACSCVRQWRRESMPGTRTQCSSLRTVPARNVSRRHAASLVAGLVLFWQAIAVPAQAQSMLEPGTEFRDCDTCPVMMVIPEGHFMMGPPPTSFGRFHHEGFLRSVTFEKPFALGKYEVTFDEWDACVREGKCDKVDDEGMGRGRRPVINVNFRQALGYTKWLAQKTGKPYRLPSEAEWEYAGRAGGALTRLLGIPPEQVCAYGNLYDLTGKKKLAYDWEHVPCDDRHAEVAPVGSFKPNRFGLHDMLGNVWEWTMDCENPRWRVNPGDGSPWLYDNCMHRAYRGGSWLEFPPVFLWQSNRYKYVNARQRDLGFRVARTLP
jgi:formylglycine-generating enzyme required for sulfatase activity